MFTANASAALKLVGESFPFGRRSRLVLTADNHNSVNGIREFARAAWRGGHLRAPRAARAAHDGAAVLARPGPARPAGHVISSPIPPSRTIRASAIRSNGSRRHTARGWDVLLDAAAFVPTNRLDLARWKPDFVTVSWYKAFGYPTGMGWLIARHEALARLRRPWFAGGAIGVASVVEPTPRSRLASTGFEDGTIDFLVAAGDRDRHRAISGRRHRRRSTTASSTSPVGSWPASSGLRHPDGSPKIRLYGPTDDRERGGTVPFNLLRPFGAIVDFPAVEAMPPNGGSRSGPAASATREPARPPAGSRPTTCVRPSRSAISRRWTSCGRSSGRRRSARSGPRSGSPRTSATWTGCWRLWRRIRTDRTGRSRPARPTSWVRAHFPPVATQ